MTPNQVADDVATEIISRTDFSYDGPFHLRLVAAIEAQIIFAYNQGLEDAAKLAETTDVSFDEDETLVIAAAIRENKIKSLRSLETNATMP